MSDLEQQTFGKTKFRYCSHNNETCDKIVEGDSCPNNAILAIYGNSGRTVYRCSIHARNFALRKINYNE